VRDLDRLDAGVVRARDVAERLAFLHLVQDQVLLRPLGEQRLDAPPQLLRARSVETHVEVVLVATRVLDQRVPPAGEDARNEVRLLAVPERPVAEDLLDAAVDYG